ncbi:MAG TPA: LysR family transcriptional regulator [Pseudomonadales bacterium]|nr:LysR family transcriptional regulator [Pseudomonadales bacterium]
MVKTIIEAGSFAGAADRLHRSQSSVSYAVHQLQQQLGVALFETVGRRALLTSVGQALFKRADEVLKQVGLLEECSVALQKGYEAELKLVMDAAFPMSVLLNALAASADTLKYTRIQLHEEILSGAEEALTEQSADISIAAHLPQGMLADPILSTDFIAVIAPSHPLAKEHGLGNSELRQHRQVVIRDSGRKNPRDVGWLGADQRWTVSSLQTAQEVVESGLAFAWLPLHQVKQALLGGSLQPLPLASGQRRTISFYLVTKEQERLGKGAQLLCQALRKAATQFQQQASENLPE